MDIARLLLRIPLLTGVCLLAGCLHLELGGAVTEATVTVAPLRDPSNIIETAETPPVGFARDLFGADTWENLPDPVKMALLGNVVLDASLYQPDALYLVTATSGLDLDPDTDQKLDDNPPAVTGQWHALLTGDQLTRGRVTPLTEAIYRYLEFNLDSLSDEQIKLELQQLSQGIVADTNKSGAVDYSDVLFWSRSLNANTYLREISRVDSLAEAIRASASASDLRALSLNVIAPAGQSGGPYTVSGTITVPSNTRVDGDVNDRFALFRDNSSIENAQDLANPVVLGGYVNEAFAGAAGASSLSGDEEDFYRVELLAGQRITLVMAEDPLLNDLDLLLYDANGRLLDASLGLAELEQIEVPEDGEYFVNVSAFEGASNYRLTLGIGALPAEVQPLRLSDDFVPGQIIARFRNKRAVNSLGKRGRLTGMRLRGGGIDSANLLELEEQPRAGNWQQQRKLRTLRKLKRLRRDANIASADLNYRMQAAALPNDVYYDQQSWHYEMINLPAAWNRSLGDGVIVAVVDTGIRAGHPDLSGQLVAGYDFVSNRNQAGDGNGIDSNPEDPGDSGGATRSSFHGTHVSGTIAAASNNTRGVAGVAWNARVMPLRALGIDGGTSFDVIQAVRYAAGLSNDSGTVPARRADIINLSLTGGGFSTADQALYSQVAALGIILVAAAGNESSSQFSYPASYADVISVSAVNINKQRARYSNFGSRVDIAAPGGDGLTRDVNGDGVADLILSTSADDSVSPTANSYALLQGTSMAAPHVAGVMALMKSVYPQLSSRDVDSLLAQGLLTDDLGSTGRDNTFGWGLINANKAVLVAESLASGGAVSLQPALSTSASSINFGTFADSLPLSISNGGTGTLVVNTILTADTWLSVSPNSVDNNGVGSYSVNVDREQLAVGSYRSAISVRTNGGETSIQVILQQPDPDSVTGGDAGLHYILLLDADTGEVFQEDVKNAVNGIYNFEFTGVPAGRYQIIGGSDADNDLFICDPGEACGAWPVLDNQPAIIEIMQDLSGLDFSSTYKIGIISEDGADSAATGEPGPVTSGPFPLRRNGPGFMRDKD